MKRDEVAGVEFDWFAVDQDDHLAVFSSFGWGAIPSSVLDAYSIDDNVDTEDALIKNMPPTGTWLPEGSGPGSCEEWKQLATIGIYVFDWIAWDGPYQRVTIPTNPIRLATIPQDLRRIFQVVRMDDVCFANSTRLQVEGVRG